MELPHTELLMLGLLLPFFAKLVLQKPLNLRRNVSAAVRLLWLLGDVRNAMYNAIITRQT